MIEVDVDGFEVKDWEKDSAPSVVVWAKPVCSSDFLNQFRNRESKFILESDEAYLYFKGVLAIEDVYMDEEQVSAELFVDSYPKWYKNKDEFLKTKI